MERKQLWTLDEWTTFGLRTQAVYVRMDSLASAISGTPGLKAKTVDAVLAIPQKMRVAMDSIANVMAKQHGERDDLLTFIFGPNGLTGEKNTALIQFCQPEHVMDAKARRSVPPMSREQWAALGHEVKEIQAEVMALKMETYKTKSGGPAVPKLAKVDSAILAAKALLEDVLVAQHPEWQEHIRVFFGVDSPKDLS